MRFSRYWIGGRWKDARTLAGQISVLFFVPQRKVSNIIFRAARQGSEALIFNHLRRKRTLYGKKIERDVLSHKLKDGENRGQKSEVRSQKIEDGKKKKRKTERCFFPASSVRLLTSVLRLLFSDFCSLNSKSIFRSCIFYFLTSVF
ncbi:MAG: hypothetical protein A3G87_09100 [Omnitrophica bacterium RIFCSPLOWO2_12_FULL_50_11]|nr:MAG: hypothetical protein A3G87_09100 [Omnitrophica bacterium RIFCSPLOWO2_12_FULL_50_11]